MTTPAASPTRASTESTPRRRFSPLKLLVVIACLALVVMWIYALFFASKDAAYRVENQAWRQQAEQICDRYRDQRLALVDTDDGLIVEPTLEQMITRADIVDEATLLLESALDEVLAMPVTTERDQSLVDDYERYYRLVIADRRVYTERLRQGDDRPYGETLVDNGPVSNVLIDFVTVNQMQSCAPPTDLSTE